MSITGNPIFNKLIGSAMEHYGVGNTVKLVIYTFTGADSELGIAGTSVQNKTDISPEPLLSAIKVDWVLRSGGNFRFSDVVMTVAKAALTEADAMNKETEFEINGDIHIILTVTPAASTWEFVVRRKL